MQKKASVPAIKVESQRDSITLTPYGTWTSRTAQNAEDAWAVILKRHFPKTIYINLLDFIDFDTSGVWLLNRTLLDFKKKGHTVILKNESTSFSTLFSYLSECVPSLDKIPPASPFFFIEHLRYLGKASLEFLSTTFSLISFLGHVILGMLFTFLNPRRLRFTALTVQMQQCGVNAIPIIFMMSIALGLVLAYQGEEQLRRFGAEIYTINLVSISMLREVGILITAILVAGRTGSAMTAQIGIMKMNQEIDALNTLGLDPMDVLIVPRVLALILIMPCLAFISDIGGLVGGGIMVVGSLHISPQLYIHRIAEAVTLGGFWIGLIKAPLFGGIIGVVSCFEGMRVSNTAESIAQYTTRAVVEGIFLVTLADALLSIFFSKIGI